ncbi:ABC transporter permease [Enterococcus rivorum]|uniref:ABC transporter permease n=2 Tax=Enterococcus rivorum TaxID=762845 RepID=A0A1E5KYY5_9ENTE|nr:ABC transporter permease [Enterococcus rivorum]MBP2099559.1 putative ABC transport system permease protein [Enterococcus rivorum]OEH82899.1 ABC transporter permease [Enterococcus rivorum]
MNFVRRALCSVTRKKGKSLILFAVIFVLGNVIAGAIAIQQSTENVEKSVKKQLGGMATVEIDYEKFQDELMKEENQKELKPLELKTIKKIGDSPYVKYYDYNASGWISSKKLKSASFGDDSSMGFPEGSFSLKGSNYAKVLDVEENKIKITEGRTFKQEEIDKGTNGAIISSKVADENGLAVGDQMVLDNVAYESYNENGGVGELYKIDTPVEIIGIFEPTSVKMKEESKDNNNGEQDKMNQQMLSTEQLNTIYLTNKLIIDMNKELFEKNKKAYPDEVTEEQEDYFVPVYVLKSPDDVDAFKQDVKPLLPKYYAVKASADQYEQIGGSMKKMSQISGYVVMIAVIATLLIISLVVLLFMRDRKHELGIYLSLGDKRSHVMGQIVIEMFLISGIALILSLITGNFLGKVVSDSLLNSDMLATAKSANQDMYFVMSGLGVSELTNADVMSAYEVKFSLGYIVTYLSVGLITVLVSAVLPLVYILRLNPKKIMM